MKYILMAIGYLIAWVLITAWIIIERIVKLFIILFQIVWHLNLKWEWFWIFKEYEFILFNRYGTLDVYYLKKLKDVYLLKKYTEICNS